MMLMYEELLTRIEQADDSVQRAKGQLPSAGSSEVAASYVREQCLKAVDLLKSIADDMATDAADSKGNAAKKSAHKPAKGTGTFTHFSEKAD
jgi:hypothetical protein